MGQERVEYEMNQTINTKMFYIFNIKQGHFTTLTVFEGERSNIGYKNGWKSKGTRWVSKTQTIVSEHKNV